jgi:lysophospholipase L1-like esterase
MRINKLLYTTILLSIGIFSYNFSTKKNIKVVFIGDSITQGEDASMAPPAITAKYLKRELVPYNVQFSNQGVSGCTTVDFLPSTSTHFLNVVKAADKFYTDKNATLIFSIMLGTNDSAIEGPLGSPVSDSSYASNLKIIIDSLLSRYPLSKFVLHHPLWYSPNTHNRSSYLQEGLSRLQTYFAVLDNLVSEYAQLHPGQVFAGDTNGFSLFKNQHEALMLPENGQDGIFFLHPNQKGAEELAKLWSNAIAGVVNNNTKGKSESGFRFPAGTLSDVPARTVSTFQNISIYWKPLEGSADKEALVRFRMSGTSEWSQAQSLWFDAREADSIGNNKQRSKEYRGSIVMLQPGTTYDIELFLKGANKIARTSASTWNERFPVSKTVNLPSHTNKTLVITKGGTASGYLLYTAPKGGTIDINNKQKYNVDILAKYVIVRGLTLKGAAKDAIHIAPGMTDVVIENNDISGWGRIASDGWAVDRDAAVSTDDIEYTGLQRIIIRHNKIHHPRSNSNNWEQFRKNINTSHPQGPQSVSFNATLGQLVIYDNDVYSDTAHYYNDCIGGGENYSYTSGFPGPDSDIYDNTFCNAWDDAIESEGMNQNVRVYNNYIDQTFVAHGVSATSIGPLYVFRNITNRLQRNPQKDFNSGYWFKSQGKDQFGGRVYVYHNTMLTVQNDGGISDVHATLANTIARNNILRSAEKAVIDRKGDPQTSCDYDLIDGKITSVNPKHEVHAIYATPLFDTTQPEKHRGLVIGSPGQDSGAIVLPNFNDHFKGKAPDMGAVDK